MANPHYVETKAEATGDGYVLNGSKAVVLNGPEADMFLVSARVGDSSIDAKEGISLFVVDKNILRVYIVIITKPTMVVQPASCSWTMWQWMPIALVGELGNASDYGSAGFFPRDCGCLCRGGWCHGCTAWRPLWITPSSANSLASQFPAFRCCDTAWLICIWKSN